MKQKIRKSDLKNLRQGELAPIAQNVAMRMRENPDYQEVLPKVDLLEQLTKSFSLALAESTSGGVDRVAAKEEAKANLIRTMYDLADWANTNDKGTLTWFTNAGFFASEDRIRKSEDLLPPTKVRVMPHTKSGELELRFALTNAQAVRTTGLEYSLDEGQSWFNGVYSTNRSLKVSGLPSRQTALFRLRTIGKGQSVSAWTEPIEVYLY